MVIEDYLSNRNFRFLRFDKEAELWMDNENTLIEIYIEDNGTVNWAIGMIGYNKEPVWSSSGCDDIIYINEVLDTYLDFSKVKINDL